MLLGRTGMARCFASVMDGSLSCDDPSGFYGYKLDGNNGIYVEWSVRDGRLTLTNDSYGLFPIYYTHHGDNLAFSSSIEDLLALDGHFPLDDAALAVFLRIGSFIGDTTPYLHIKAIPPGAELRFSEDGFSLKSNPIECGKGYVDRDEALKTYGELFHESIIKFHDALTGKVGIPLSGGRDSRHILFELIESEMRPHSCITLKHIPPKPDEDSIIAGRLCAELGMNHVILEHDSSFLSMEREKNRLTNFCSLEHSWYLPMARYLSQEGYTGTFDGIGGDVLSAGLFLTEQRLDLYRQGRLEELADDILGEEGYFPSMLKGRYARRFSRDAAIRLMVDELRKHENTSNPVAQFFFWNRTRRNIALSGWRIMYGDTHVFAPYLDHELYSFLTSLPAEYFLDYTFHQRAIEKRYPQWAHIPYETKKAPLKVSGKISSCLQTAEFLVYFLRLFMGKSMCRPAFIYPRLVKGMFSARYYDHVKIVCRTPVYLTELLR